MQLLIDLDHVDDEEAVFTMTIVGEPSHPSAGTYSVSLGQPITLELPNIVASDE